MAGFFPDISSERYKAFLPDVIQQVSLSLHLFVKRGLTDANRVWLEGLPARDTCVQPLPRVSGQRLYFPHMGMRMQ